MVCENRALLSPDKADFPEHARLVERLHLLVRDRARVRLPEAHLRRPPFRERVRGAFSLPNARPPGEGRPLPPPCRKADRTARGKCPARRAAFSPLRGLPSCAGQIRWDGRPVLAASVKRSTSGGSLAANSEQIFWLSLGSFTSKTTLCGDAPPPRSRRRRNSSYSSRLRKEAARLLTVRASACAPSAYRMAEGTLAPILHSMPYAEEMRSRFLVSSPEMMRKRESTRRLLNMTTLPEAKREQSSGGK